MGRPLDPLEKILLLFIVIAIIVRKSIKQELIKALRSCAVFCLIHDVASNSPSEAEVLTALITKKSRSRHYPIRAARSHPLRSRFLSTRTTFEFR